MQAQSRTISLVRRVMFAMIIAGLLPIISITAGAIRGFHTADKERNQLQREIAVVGLLGLGILALTGAAVRRMLVPPLARLTAVARRLEQGEFDEEQLTPIRQRRFPEEVTLLANVFAEMGSKVVQRE